MSKTAERRGAKAWRQYVVDTQAWREKYVQLAEKYVAAVMTDRKGDSDMTARTVTVEHECGYTEFIVPDRKMKLVKLLLFEVATGAQNTPDDVEKTGES